MNAFILDAVLKEDDGVALLFSLLLFDAGDVFFVSLFVDALLVLDDGATWLELVRLPGMCLWDVAHGIFQRRSRMILLKITSYDDNVVGGCEGVNLL